MPNNSTIPLSEGTQKMLKLVKDDLFPLLNQLRNLLLDIQGCRTPFIIFSKKLYEFESEYSKVSILFFDVSRTLETPDILFKGLKDDPQNISSYLQFRGVISETLADGFSYIEMIDRTLDRKNQNIQNNRTFILALVAIIISIISI